MSNDFENLRAELLNGNTMSSAIRKLSSPSPTFIMLLDRDSLLVAGGAVAASTAFLLFHSLKQSRPKGSATPAQEGDRRYLIGGNWKCNGSTAKNEELIKIFNKAGSIPSNVDVVVCAPFPYLPQTLSTLRDDIEIGAQNCGHNTAKGAYTGEVGAFQLKDIGCTWVIIGHSERREGFGMIGESDALCAQKCKIAVDAGLKVMFCIGEKKEERETGVTMDICAKQLDPLIKILDDTKDWDMISIAYEPIWAIGTGLTATPEMAQETHANIRKYIADKVSSSVAKSIRIQYGGSMKGDNAKELLSQPDIDGGLIGGASLTEYFFGIINGVPK
jgi:triosephosphate isomerase